MTVRTRQMPSKAIPSSRTFLYKAPLASRPGIQPKQSVYYWWYEFLRRNEDYRRCCFGNGRGRLAKLYQDFGNVHRGDFQRWWQDDDRGQRLFAEPPAPIRLEELHTPDDWDTDWSHDQVLVIVVPLGEPRRRINRWFKRVLARRHIGRPGYPTKRSTAAYPVHQKFSVLALEQTLAVYDCRQSHPDLTLAEIGKRLRLVPSAMPKVGDSISLLARKRNTMGATVSRYLKKAEAMIRNTAFGKFPCVD